MEELRSDSVFDDEDTRIFWRDIFVEIHDAGLGEEEQCGKTAMADADEI